MKAASPADPDMIGYWKRPSAVEPKRSASFVEIAAYSPSKYLVPLRYGYRLSTLLKEQDKLADLEVIIGKGILKEPCCSKSLLHIKL